MKVFDLRGQEGNFETAPLDGRTGWRSFGFWSSEEPEAGDLVIRPNQHSPKGAIYLIEDVGSLFTGSWTGTMKDAIHFNLIAPGSDIEHAIVKHEATKPNATQMEKANLELWEGKYVSV